MQFSNYGAHSVQPDPRLAYSRCTVPPQHLPVQTEQQFVMVPSWWMPTDCTNQAPAPPQQQVLKLQELLRFENSLELWQPKADASQQVWLQPSSNLADVSPGIENGQIGVPEQAWEAAEDVEEILSSTVVQNAEQCFSAQLQLVAHLAAWLTKRWASFLFQDFEVQLRDLPHPLKKAGEKAVEKWLSLFQLGGSKGSAGFSLACPVAVEFSEIPFLKETCTQAWNKPQIPKGNGLDNLLNDPRLAKVLSALRSKAYELTYSRAIMRTVWAVGKLGLKGRDVQGIIAVLAETSQPILTQFSCQELSNTLWGLARLSESMQGLKPEGIRLAYAVMAQGVSRLSQFSTQCLTNSLWAVAKLGLRGEEVRDFSNQCLSQIHLVLFKEMSPQGLANSLWACAKLQSDSREAILDIEVVGRFCIDAARRAMASEDLLKLFFPQELSMALWAMAKLIGRRARANKTSDAFEAVSRFAEAVAVEATSRVHDFSPQGVSTIAWSLATLDMVTSLDTYNFFNLAAQVAAANIRAYPPQAIANCCWAFNRLGRKEAVLARFGKAAAEEAMRRIDEFSWQDLQGALEKGNPVGKRLVTTGRCTG
ncbi:unnamed protein product [Symbiodinium sp. CCMP2456]|nr:unnamed protein product [Symbiodinium sp. CCMP2456]